MELEAVEKTTEILNAQKTEHFITFDLESNTVRDQKISKLSSKEIQHLDLGEIDRIQQRRARTKSLSVGKKKIKKVCDLRRQGKKFSR